MNKIKIPLTGARPVSIDPSVWPIVATADGFSPPMIECQANYVWQIQIRQHADGRMLISGSSGGGPGGCVPGTPELRAGEIVEPGNDRASNGWAPSNLAAAAERIAAAIDHPELAQEVLTDLEPIDLD